MRDIFIYDHVRTPRGRGKPDGALHEATPVELVRQLLVALKERNALPDDSLDELVLGTVSAAGEQGATLSRIAPILAGFSDRAAGLHINRACASALEAVSILAAKIGCGMAEMAIAGGVESMSRIPMGADGGGPHGIDPRVSNHTPFVMQGVSADLLATLNGYSRADLDAYALASQQRAAQAWSEGRFDRAVVPVVDVLGTVLLAHDEHIRPDATLETLGALKPAFAQIGKTMGFDGLALQRYPEVDRIEHVHTAASSSGIVDGAGLVLIGSAQAGADCGMKPRARIRSFITLGSEPALMLDGPTPACQRALDVAGLVPADIDLWELNEAFAAVPLRLMDTMNIPHDRMNVNGGAIAMGHPLGATGAMIAGTLVDEMERRDVGLGVVTLCAAGGMGIAMVLERAG
ncbi:MAG: acetyl-CoA acetyltransferase [Novosphingobium sp. 28-62-57]|uniref:acetyl-CoA C-acetyltransferase n=1 Tax=unclassified Novosphingobium TaxID=2644732 RepID=UPI000BD123D3|nr:MULTISPECIES: acetyl-CoA C-acetyltransferase [unclassified Novosphingobium]OYW51147.1 MAG: acetyl-CoA acetyltransferase [Novosphingobium sp. 12-62-10]OYZ11032.1 MAG: acetyl-CoA acetyltransferase [Novosphingobium sp. 28-62-57]HQS70955.1 acetyl-CoA C-acetyltransferase [Novosphingobium sp.]